MLKNIFVYDVCPNDGLDQKCGVSQYWHNVRSELVSINGSGLRLKISSVCPTSILSWFSFSITVRRCDIIHIQYPLEIWGNSITPGVFAPIFLRLFSYSSTIVCTMHEWHRMHKLRRMSILPLVLLSSRIIFVSVRELDSYKKSIVGRLSNFFGQRCSVIPIGVNLNIYDVNRDEVLKERLSLVSGRGDNSYNIATFGFIYSAKRPHVSIESIACLRERGINAWLDFYGEAPEGGGGLERELRQLADSFGVGNYVKFHGYQSDDRILQLKLMASDMLLQLYDDGLTARRGSYWYAYSLGVSIVTSEPVSSKEFEEAGLPNPSESLGIYTVSSSCEASEISVKCIDNLRSWNISTPRPAPVSWSEIASKHMMVYAESR